MASYELNDLWWLKPPPKMVEAVDGMRLGMQLRQQGFENKMQVMRLEQAAIAQQMRNQLLEQKVGQDLVDSFRETESFRRLDEYTRQLNATLPDQDAPLPPNGLINQHATQAHTALSDWRNQRAVQDRIKANTDTFEAITKYENDLLGKATELLNKGGRNVIKVGPRGPYVDPGDLSTAAKEFNDQKFAPPVLPAVAGMTPDVLRVRLSDGTWVTYRSPKPGLTKEQFVQETLPKLVGNYIKGTDLTKALEDGWQLYSQAVSGGTNAAPSTNAAPIAVPASPQQSGDVWEWTPQGMRKIK